MARPAQTPGSSAHSPRPDPLGCLFAPVGHGGTLRLAQQPAIAADAQASLKEEA
ncbi:MAG: hypothetical protein IGR92_03135 [Leptolyngbyaceae cyanobacterium T60_A2020_046]|nr:hypothetical protein [Leptolyngbyaceae cyanobacterium T60_A2020_046]